MPRAELESSKRVRKFYFLSLFCLIPILGFLFGVILIIYALLVFKNYKLLFVILINVGIGILFMKFEKDYLKRDLMFGKDTEGLFSKLDADLLDKITKSLEDYKRKNGEYPDSLEELNKMYPELEIIDPLLGRNPSSHNQINFYYNKTANKYILFSVGVDGVPNTKDDIFPRKPLK